MVYFKYPLTKPQKRAKCLNTLKYKNSCSAGINYWIMFATTIGKYIQWLTEYFSLC